MIVGAGVDPLGSPNTGCPSKSVLCFCVTTNL